jgi:uncharacterized protein
MLTAMVIAVALFAMLVAFAWWAQERIVFQPSGPPFPHHGDTRRLEYHAADDQQLFGFVVQPEPAGSPARVLIAFHGNADLAVRQIPWAEEVARRSGWTVLLAEYRGYGGAPGTPSVSGLRLDAQAALAIARDSLGGRDGEIAYFGHSLGSAVATELAASAPPSRLILQSPFTSARDMARIIVARPLEAAWRFISRVHYDNITIVGELDAPVWVVHGANDMIIPASMGAELHERARIQGELRIVPGAGHNDLPERGGAIYWRWIDRALE